MAEAAGNAHTPVVTIDGPGGAGKGTIGRMLAEQLGWAYLDSGALYRILAHVALQKGVDLADEQAVAAIVPGLDVVFLANPGADSERIQVNGEEVGDALRTEECGDAASRVAALPAVRQALLEWQRAFRRAPGLVADGRDMGTVVFPDAPLKLFLTASPGARAERRYKQLKQKGMDANLSRLTMDIAERDRRDSERAVAPLRPAEDATVIDSTELTIPEVVSRVVELASERFPGSHHNINL